jgi:hypothetical protein
VINEEPLCNDISLPIGGIRDSGLNGSTDKIEEMAYIKRIHVATWDSSRSVPASLPSSGRCGPGR